MARARELSVLVVLFPLFHVLTCVAYLQISQWLFWSLGRLQKWLLTETNPSSFALCCGYCRVMRARWDMTYSWKLPMQIFCCFGMLSIIGLASSSHEKGYGLIVLERSGRAGPWWAGGLFLTCTIARNWPDTSKDLGQKRCSSIN